MVFGARRIRVEYWSAAAEEEGQYKCNSKDRK
jgi:hypothetical protein